MAEHVYQGGCPDETQPDTRDANCPACELLVETARLEADLFDARRMLGLYVAYAPAETHERVRAAYKEQDAEAAAPH